MNKHLIIAGSILLVGLVFITIFAYDSYIDDQKYRHNPVDMSSYEISDYYKIDPGTILDALNGGETNVFMPL